MGPLVRLRLTPTGVWTTPWQADSLLGAMACGWARSHGPDALQRDLLDPWLAGAPPFVISDAFPGNTLPAPAILPLWWDWPPERRKEVKHLRRLGLADFSAVQRGERPRLETPRVTVNDGVRLRNSVSRHHRQRRSAWRAVRGSVLVLEHIRRCRTSFDHLRPHHRRWRHHTHRRPGDAGANRIRRRRLRRSRRVRRGSVPDAVSWVRRRPGAPTGS